MKAKLTEAFVEIMSSDESGENVADSATGIAATKNTIPSLLPG